MLPYSIYPGVLRWQSKINAKDSAARAAARARACLDGAALPLRPRVAARLGVRGPGHEPIVFAQSTGFVCRGGGRHRPVPLPGVTLHAAGGCTGPAFKQHAAYHVVYGACVWQVEDVSLGPFCRPWGAGGSVWAGGGHFVCFRALFRLNAD